MNTLEFLEQLAGQPAYNGQIAHIEHIPEREAVWAELDKPLPDDLQNCLGEHGLLPLYTRWVLVGYLFLT